MAASVVITESNGPVGSSTESLDIANVNLGSIDQAELDPSSYPIVAAADGHSYEKWLRLYISTLDTSTQIDNIKIWLSDLGGGWKIDEAMSCNLKTSGYGASAYATPIETDSIVATEAMLESEPSGPNLGIGGLLSGAITVAPAYSDYCVLQLDVTENTPAGAVNQKTITFQYDEM